MCRFLCHAGLSLAAFLRLASASQGTVQAQEPDVLPPLEDLPAADDLPLFNLPPLRTSEDPRRETDAPTAAELPASAPIPFPLGTDEKEVIDLSTPPRPAPAPADGVAASLPGEAGAAGSSSLSTENPATQPQSGFIARVRAFLQRILRLLGF